MNLTPKFMLAAALVAASVALTGCGLEPAQQQELAELNGNSLNVPQTVSKLPKGVYEVGVQAPQGPQVCIASVHETSHRSNQVVLTDCKADARGGMPFVRTIDIPRALSNAAKGSYEVTVQTSEGSKNCTASVIETSHRSNQVILGGCTP